MEGVIERNDFVFIGVDGVAVGAGHLEGALHGFRAGVGEKGALQSADFGQAFGQRTLVLVVIQIRTVDQQSGLLADDLQDPRMGMSQRVDPDAGYEIEIAAAFRIVHIAAFTAHQRQRVT